MHAEGLADEYLNNANAWLVIKSLCILAFLPCDEINDAFEELQDVVEHDTTLPDAMAHVMDYFETTYIGRRRGRGRQQPRFPKQSWNVRERTVMGLPRTTNKIEGWNRGLQSMFDGPHPTMWKFLEGLQREQAVAHFEIQSWKNGRAPPLQEKKYRDLNERLERLIQQQQSS